MNMKKGEAPRAQDSAGQGPRKPPPQHPLPSMGPSIQSTERSLSRGWAPGPLVSGVESFSAAEIPWSLHSLWGMMPGFPRACEPLCRGRNPPMWSPSIDSTGLPGKRTPGSTAQCSSPSLFLLSLLSLCPHLQTSVFSIISHIGKSEDVHLACEPDMRKYLRPHFKVADQSGEPPVVSSLSPCPSSHYLPHSY